MHIEMIDTLRCPSTHEDSWLVGAFDRLVDREVIAGRLGCPVCGATYEISNGVVDFDGDDESRSDPHRRDAGRISAVGADDAIRLAAMLDLASPGGLVVLEGAWSAAGEMLASFIDARLLVMNPPPSHSERSPLSALRSRHTIPVAAGSCRGIALYCGGHAEVLARTAVDALRPGGRLVAPADTPMPMDARELARDDRWWVAERSSPPPALVTLGVRPPIRG